MPKEQSRFFIRTCFGIQSGLDSSRENKRKNRRIRDDLTGTVLRSRPSPGVHTLPRKAV